MGGCGTNNAPKRLGTIDSIVDVHVITSHVIAFNAIGVSGIDYWVCGLVHRCGSRAPTGAGAGVGVGTGVGYHVLTMRHLTHRLGDGDFAVIWCGTAHW